MILELTIENRSAKKGIIEANSKEAKTDRNITIRELERNDISETVEQETNK